MEYEEELIRLQKAAERLDLSDPEVIKKWMLATSHLGASTQSQILKIPTNKIRLLRKRLLGITYKTNLKQKEFKYTKRGISTLQAPENWKTAEWLTEASKCHTHKEIAEAVGLTQTQLSWIFYKLGAKTHHKNKNKYCNKRWIYEHYITKDMPPSVCAKIAGVTNYTFYEWLVKFNIPIKNRIQTADLWTKNLIRLISDEPCVHHAIYRHGVLKIIYTNGLHDKLFINQPGKRGYKTKKCAFRKVPKIRPRFEKDLLGQDYKYHITIDKSEWEKASIPERLIVKNNFVDAMMERQNCPIIYPEEHIDEVVNKCLTVKIDTLANREITAKNYIIRGVKHHDLMFHYFDVSDYTTQFTHRKLASVFCQSVVSNKQIMSSDITRAFTTRFGDKIKYINPGLLMILFAKLQLHNKSILDISPYYGFKAIAAARFGCKYYTLPEEKFDKAIQNGYADRLKLDHEIYNGQGIDLLILDNNFISQPDINSIKQYASNVKNIAFYVEVEKKRFGETFVNNLDDLKLRYKPTYVIPLRLNCFCSELSYLFIF